jgi:hypothetical protein
MLLEFGEVQMGITVGLGTEERPHPCGNRSLQSVWAEDQWPVTDWNCPPGQLSGPQRHG